MDLKKLMISAEGGTKIEALFNPNKLVFNKTVGWQKQEAKGRDVPELQFTNAQPRTLNLDLIFDTYDPVQKGTKKNLKDYTDNLLKLAAVEGDRHRPPVCELSWGTASIFFKGVLERLELQFTLFLEDGTPVRATCRCTFKEWRTNPDDQRRQDTKSSDIPKSRVVRRGDTLSSIAAEEYLDPGKWRPIADENGIDDPLNLVPGKELLIPALTMKNSNGRFGS